MRIIHLLLAASAIASSLVLAACGGGGSSAPAPVAATPAPAPSGDSGNVVPITIDGGTDGLAFNTPFVSVTVCVPGTSTCQQIDHVLVDTGSSGLRLAASAVAALGLPKLTGASGNALAECASFASGYSWGSVRVADVRVGGETAPHLPVEVVNDTSIPAAPSACKSGGANFGVGPSNNGILGVGVFAQDCGAGCAIGAANGLYWSCDTSTCAGSTAPLASQVTNPIAYFASDNNGAMITLPAVPLTGASTVSGTLVFGIGTRANNQLGGATVFTADSRGSVQTTFNGTRYSAFFDTGSNALFFTDANLPQCSGGFYCPSSPQTLSAIVTSAAGVASTVSFTVEGFQSISASATAGPIAGVPIGLDRAFDWGLPFFFGRTVFVAMAGASTPAGPGPYWAF